MFVCWTKLSISVDFRFARNVAGVTSDMHVNHGTTPLFTDVACAYFRTFCVGMVPRNEVGHETDRKRHYKCKCIGQFDVSVT